LSLFGGEESGSELVNCELDPNNPDCEISEVTEEDCFFNQVFTGDYCRLMISPKNLDYGEESLLLVVGQEMQALTPSFTGDGPQNWLINPRLPEGLSLDLESGVISGVPESESLLTSYTIIGKNIVGSSVYIIDIEVLSQPPENITYSANEIFCTISKPCGISSPYNSGGLIENWEVIPALPLGLEILASGGISGTVQQLGDSNHTISGSNSGGSAYTDIRIITIHEEPVNLYYSSNFFQWLLDDNIEESPNIEGGEIINWTIEPPLPDGLIFSQNDGSIIGIPSELHAIREHYVTATNTGGSITTTILISVQDISPTNIRYEPYLLDLTVNEEMSNLSPSWSDGTPESWEISPNLPQGLTLNPHNGEISGTPIYVQESMDYQIWANNTGGFTETQISISISSLPPDEIYWPESEYILRSNTSVLIPVINNGPYIDTWEVSPSLPSGLIILDNGTISGIPDSRTDWNEYTIWANNTGGAVGLIIWIVVHDLRADQNDLLRGMSEADFGGWPSPILPIGEWAFPVAFESSGIPVVSASHVGKGKILGYGHESWVDANHPFSLRAVEWVCGENAEVGLAYGAGFDDFENKLQDAGHNVHLSVTPSDLTGIDCLLDEFWNGHDDNDNAALVDFMNSGGGVIMGGHAWYWSYSNTDVAHNYPGNKIAKSTGLFVSSDWGYNDVYFQNIPHEYSTISNAIAAVLADRIDGIEMANDDAAVAYSALSDCTGIVTLDYTDFWTPLRHLVNQTGYTVIPYSTLWSSTGYELGADPVADIILRLEDALMFSLPADELPIHPSHIEFPGEVPLNATRITRTVTVNGTQSGLPSNFGYSNPRSSLRMSTGLYAPPGEIITITVDQETSELGFSILIGAHTDGLWNKEIIKRHSRIYRTWSIENTTTIVANAFGGPIYAYIPAGSAFGEINVTISGAIRAPLFVLGETSDFEWIYSERDNPAPWAELVSNNFIMTVPSSEILDLNNPSQLMNWWDRALEMEHELYGFEPWPRVERAVFDAQISVGWMHSGYPFMAHDLSVPDVVNYTHMSENGDWGMFHELGHNHQWMPSTLPGTTETSCNFASVYLMEDLVGVEGHGAVDPEQRRNRMESYFSDGSNISNWSVWTALDTYLIIKEEWGWNPITEALSVYYNLSPAEVPSTEEEEFNTWVLHLSNSTGYNLAPYHAAWGFPLNENTYSTLEHLPIWVEDPLRGEFFSYDAIIRNIESNDETTSTTDISWETYDNGTNTSLTFYYGVTDMGNQSSGWSSSQNLGSTSVGNHSTTITGLSWGTTYYGRIQVSNDENTVWFGPISWTTDYPLD
tara:strand:- start:2965 stop:6888 length:3924 start_codon:yes stop_codon:yes gene_type:complete